jgi:hypothetical protein
VKGDIQPNNCSHQPIELPLRDHSKRIYIWYPLQSNQFVLVNMLNIMILVVADMATLYQGR